MSIGEYWQVMEHRLAEIERQAKAAKGAARKSVQKSNQPGA